MSLSPKEILLAGCDVLMYGLNHVVFNVALLGATCAHMVAQALKSNDSDPTSFLVFVQDAADFYMIWLYTFVLVLRVCSRGLVFNPDAILRVPWAYLDIVIVLLAWLDKIYHFGRT
jgi:hypothetical protein